MNLQDITTWTISADHKARPKNPFDNDIFSGSDKEWQEWEAFINQHIYACSPTLVAGDYPAEDVELVWQYKGILTDEWASENPNAYKNHPDFNHYTQYAKSLDSECVDTRQYLQLKQPVKEQTSNERNIEECIREYEANKLLKPFLIDADIFKGMSKHFHVAIKKDVNGYCISCHKEPCACHLIPLI